MHTSPIEFKSSVVRLSFEFAVFDSLFTCKSCHKVCESISTLNMCRSFYKLGYGMVVKAMFTAFQFSHFVSVPTSFIEIFLKVR